MENETKMPWEDLADNLSTISNMITDDAEDLKEVVENYRKLYDLIIQEENRGDGLEINRRELDLKEAQLEFEKEKEAKNAEIQMKTLEIEEKKIKSEYVKSGLMLGGTVLSLGAWIAMGVKTMLFEESGHVIRSKAWPGIFPKKF